MHSAYAYRDSEILSASPARLLLLTYDGLLSSLLRAKTGITLSNDDVMQTGTEKARALLCELIATLNRSVPGDLPERLATIYVFLLGELDSAVIRRDAVRIERMMSIVRNLRDAFEQASASTPRLPLA